MGRIVHSEMHTQLLPATLVASRDHGCTDQGDFNRNFKLFILNLCSPASLEVSEHKFIHGLKSLRPMGLNTSNPFEIPLLDHNVLASD